MDNRALSRRQLNFMVVFLVAIHSLLDLILSYILERRRIRRVHDLEDDPDDQLNVNRRRLVAWEIHVQRTINSPWYCKPRTTKWYNLFVDWSPAQDPERFRQFFRITPAMFSEICELVRSDLTTATPHQFQSLPNRVLIVERQVAVALRQLATGDTVLGIAELFGISKQTASRCIWNFIKSFSIRGRAFLSWPDPDDMATIKADFNQRWGFPNCCGAIDATHFPIDVLAGENATAYYDWKHNISVTMQAIVDSRCRFLDVFVGCPGSIQDSRLLRTSAFFRNVVFDSTKLNGPPLLTCRGSKISEYILGDVGYPLYKWLIVPFPRRQLEETDVWNHKHSSARMCVERTFGSLKGCWRILSQIILKPKVDRLAKMILSCVLLHNMSLLRVDDGYRAQWNDFPPHPPSYGPFNRPTNQFFDGGREARTTYYKKLDR